MVLVIWHRTAYPVVGIRIGEAFNLLWIVTALGGFEALSDRTTPGRALMGLRVIGRDDQPLAQSKRIARGVVKFCEFLFTLRIVSLILVLTGRGTLPDMAASSKVVEVPKI